MQCPRYCRRDFGLWLLGCKDLLPLRPLQGTARLLGRRSSRFSVPERKTRDLFLNLLLLFRDFIYEF